MILDVGCGTNPKGNVNIDLYVTDFGHRLDNSVIDYRKTPNFVLCDLNNIHFPFIDNYFDEVYSNQVIEHINNPIKFMNEILRVCKKDGLIILRLPHFIGEIFSCRNKYHKWRFSRKWFAKHYNVISSNIYCYRLFMKVIPIGIPSEFEVRIKKK